MENTTNFKHKSNMNPFIDKKFPNKRYHSYFDNFFPKQVMILKELNY